MYSQQRYTTGVRDRGPRYENVPFPSEGYPGARALEDLRSAPAPDIPRILARYAVIRAIAFSGHGAGAGRDPVADHAFSAALEHLDRMDERVKGVDGEWGEGELLRRAFGRGGGQHTLELLLAAADAAEAAGHGHGARALRETVHRARWSGGFPPASLS